MYCFINYILNYILNIINKLLFYNFNSCEIYNFIVVGVVYDKGIY